MTAHTLESDRARWLSAGLDGYVAKPLGLAALREALAAAVLAKPTAVDVRR
jgi:CheY-like chemotaxis protein